LPSARRPKAEKGEAGFAASGTNMCVVGDRVLIALGGAENNQQRNSSRIVVSNNRGKSWTAVSVPIVRNESSGIFSVHFIDDKRGLVVGGNYLKPEIATDNIAVTSDGGETWNVATGTPPRGFRSCLAQFKNDQKAALVCVGTGGTDISTDGGQNWSAISDTGFHAVAFTPDGKFGWATGSDGRIARWK